jgi:hypothetical protein
LTPWKMSACRLSIEKTMELLCNCVGKQTLRPGSL